MTPAELTQSLLTGAALPDAALAMPLQDLSPAPGPFALIAARLGGWLRHQPAARI